jgi:ankyrin repeat protein
MLSYAELRMTGAKLWCGCCWTGPGQCARRERRDGAVFRGCGYKAVARLLLDQGAAVEAPGMDGRTALQEAAVKGHKAVVRLLLDHRAMVDVPDGYRGWTALYEAVAGGHSAVVRLLLDRGATFDAPDIDG